MLKQWFSIKDTAHKFSQQKLKEQSDDVNLEELHLALLEMYSDIAELCNEHGLNIFAVGGTALGAIRHQGFIPWDDDIDLGMLREDYEKLINIFPSSELSEKYMMTAPNTSGVTPNRFLQFYHKNTSLKTLHNLEDSQFQMLFLDVFPYDSVSDSWFVCQYKGFVSLFLMLIASSVDLVTKNSEMTKAIFYSTIFGKFNYLMRRAIGKLFSFKSSSDWFAILDSFVANKSTQTLRLTSAMGSKHYFGETLNRDVIMPLREVSFHNLSIKVPARVNDYLKMLYGDTYMQIPTTKYTHAVLSFSYKVNN